MKIMLNGAEKDMVDELTISKLLSQLKIAAPGTAVAINGEIISREKFDAQAVNDGDAVDILRPIGGG